MYGGIIMKLETRYSNHFDDVKHYDTETLRKHFLVEDVFVPGEMKLVYSHNDRIIFGGITPTTQALKLEGSKELAATYFLERRELGVINIGGDGFVNVDGKEYAVNHYDAIYVGMGVKEISFTAKDASNPPKFYMNSGTAHKSYPTVLISYDDANHKPLGSLEDCNKRTINQYIHDEVFARLSQRDGVEYGSCQIAMGLTKLDAGSNWNTMPCHTHERRMEVYLYFDMDEDNVVFHMMGKPDETRHLVMKNESAVISPSWSIHSGVGTKAYTFIWGMVGENKDYDDQDWLKTGDLK
jgi:4-deoxy-L-threo-5-hexosulose-uronate ketol-isomerase